MKTQKRSADVDAAAEDGKQAVALASFLSDGRKAERSDSTGKLRSQQGDMYFHRLEPLLHPSPATTE